MIMKRMLKKLKNLSPAAVMMVLLTLGFLMRVPQLNGSFWLDEAAQVLESSRPFSHQLQIRDDFQPPLIHLLVFTLLQYSKSEVWLRLGAALVPGLITLWATIEIGRRYFSPRVGWLSGLLLATSSFHIFYSQELRPYSLPAMFAVLGWWAVLELTQRKSETSAAGLVTRQLGVFGVWSILGLYSSYLYPFALVGQLVFLFFQFRKDPQLLKRVLLTTTLVCLAFAPWIPSFIDQLQAGQQLRNEFTGWENVVSFDQFRSLSLTSGKFVFGVLDLAVQPIFILVLLEVAATGAYLMWALQNNPVIRKGLGLTICWLIIPVLGAWVISFVVPVLQPKRVLFALPAFYLAISLLVTQALQQKTKFVQAAALLLAGSILSINLFSSFSYYTQTKYQRENWREVQAYIEEKYDPNNSIVLFAFPDQFASWQWYNNGRFPTAATGVFVVSEDPLATDRQIIKQLTDYQFILVFDYLRDLTDPQHQIEADLERYGFQQVGVIPGNAPLGMIRVFARAGQIIGFSEYCPTCYENRN